MTQHDRTGGRPPGKVPPQGRPGLDGESERGEPAETEQYQDKVAKTLRVKLSDRPGSFAQLATAVGQAGALLGDIVRVQVSTHFVVRDVTVYVDGGEHLERVVEAVEALGDVQLLEVRDEVLTMHRGGKIRIVSTVPLRTLTDLRTIYTPGVAQVAKLLRDEPEKLRDYTAVGNTVAIVTNGTAVLGLGDVGVRAALPVMEGKAALLDAMVGVGCMPILVDSRSPGEVVRVVERIATGFAMILLEDIAAPACFEVEGLLRQRLDIPVFHDDQHGTAVVVLAALINALAMTDRSKEALRVLISGAGAAGMAIARKLLYFGVRDVVVCDRAGALYQGRRERMTPYKDDLAAVTNPEGLRGPISEVIRGRDVFIGVSTAHLVTEAMVEAMAADPIVFSLANPIPEIGVKAALAAGAVVAADGRTINNALGFPGITRGALDARASSISEAMELAAAEALAEQTGPGELVPEFLSREVHKKVAAKVVQAARYSGAARPF